MAIANYVLLAMFLSLIINRSLAILRCNPIRLFTQQERGASTLFTPLPPRPLLYVQMIRLFPN